jgi:hypothetical protein
MTLVTLSPEAWDALEPLAAHPTDARLLRRAQALRWLDDGETVPEVAARRRVTCQAVDKWVAPCRTYGPPTWRRAWRQASAVVVPAPGMGALRHASWPGATATRASWGPVRPSGRPRPVILMLDATILTATPPL